MLLHTIIAAITGQNDSFFITVIGNCEKQK